MKILELDPDLVTEIPYLNASPRGRTEVARLPVVRARVDALGDDLDAIVACSDLQGRVRGERDIAMLLGVRVAEVLEELAAGGAIPRGARTGVILAGDLYSVPAANERGGHGPVVEVWEAFAERFAWVAGVAGNHDDVTGIAGRAGMYLLDGEVAELDGLRIGGVGGIIGNTRKPGRRSEAAQLELVERTLVAGADILVLHEGPCGSQTGQPGNPLLRETIDVAEVPLVICGHAHWQAPLAASEGGQILNVDSRVVVLSVAG